MTFKVQLCTRIRILMNKSYSVKNLKFSGKHQIIVIMNLTTSILHQLTTNTKKQTVLEKVKSISITCKINPQALQVVVVLIIWLSSSLMEKK